MKHMVFNFLNEFKRMLLNFIPLTRPTGDLSHKGRGYPAFDTVRSTSPLVREVAATLRVRGGS
jgi:hypothetical protein